METMKEKGNRIVLCLFELIVGVLLLINPVGFTAGIITVTGIALIVLGLIEIVKYFGMRVEEAALEQALVKGLVSVLVGAFCTFRAGWFIITFPVLTIIYGVVILLVGLGKIQLTVDMVRRKSKHWIWAAINAVISIVCAIVILNNPFTSTTLLWMLTGISLIVEGIFDVITFFCGKKEMKAEQKSCAKIGV